MHFAKWKVTKAIFPAFLSYVLTCCPVILAFCLPAFLSDSLFLPSSLRQSVCRTVPSCLLSVSLPFSVLVRYLSAILPSCLLFPVLVPCQSFLPLVILSVCFTSCLLVCPPFCLPVGLPAFLSVCGPSGLPVGQPS